MVKVAISPVSEAGAIANIDAEVADFDFDRVRAQAKQEWTQARCSISMRPSTPAAVPTALYHTCWGRRCSWMPMANAGRQCRAQGRGLHELFHVLAVDTYVRCTCCDAGAAGEAQQRQWMLAHHEHSPYGMLPVWSFHGLEDWCMIGYHAVPVIADAYVKGIRGFDADKRTEGDDRDLPTTAPMTASRIPRAGLCADRRGRRGRQQDAGVRLAD